MTLLEMCALAAVIIFAFLAGFLIRALLPLHRSLTDVEKKLREIEPLFKLFQKSQEIEDKEIKKIRDTKKIYEEKEEDNTIGFDVIEWLLLSLKLGEKIIKRR